MTTTVSLAQAYALIHDDLRRVEALLARELRSPDKSGPQVAALCGHLARFRGKMLRPALLLLTARATGTVRPIHLGLAAVIEMFHLATLVHDDVLDEASMRRQATTINQGWGNEAAVMLGDWLISHAYHLCSQQGSQWASLEISAVAHRVCEGELMQLSRRGRSDISADEYMEVITAKTAELTGLSARLGARFNEAAPQVERACQEYGVDLGVAFQITDDLLDLVGDEREAGKTLGSDLAKGKATLPLIHYLSSAGPQEARRITRLLAGRPEEGRPAALGGAPAGGMAPSRNGPLGELRRRLIDSGAIESAEAVARQFVHSAKARLADLPDGPARAALELLAEFVLLRSH